MIRNNYMNFWTILIVLSIFFSVNVFAVQFNATHYENVMLIQAQCTEYKGFVRFIIPTELANLSTYYDGQLAIDKSSTTDIYNKNWYVFKANSAGVADLEKMYDQNTNTYAIFSDETITVFLRNPTQQRFSQIQFFAPDTQILGASIVVNGRSIPSKLVSTTFSHTLSFDAQSATELTMTLTVKTPAKIGEITLIEQQNKPVTYAYLYVDNNCAQVQKVYFGRFGKHTAYAGNHYLARDFAVNVSVQKNPQYVADFDSDLMLNEKDNCPFVNNTDQKDINYNLIGDACEDDDRDGILNGLDNCPAMYNPDQIDSDRDKAGDDCDKVDDRPLEKNAWVLYVLAVVLILVFIVLAWKMNMSVSANKPVEVQKGGKKK